MDPLSDLYSLRVLFSVQLIIRVIRVSRRAGPVPKIICLRLSALALWNFASGEPTKGRIPQGESVVNLFLLPAASCQLECPSAVN